MYAQRSVFGVIWGVLQSASIRILAFATQILLARMLLKEDFGLFAIMNSVTVIVMSIVSNNGVPHYFVTETTVNSELENSAFWYSLIWGVGGCSLFIALAPVLGIFYQSTTIIFLLLLGSFLPVLGSISQVPLAKMQKEFRFKNLSLQSTLASVVEFVITITLTFLGSGVVALALGKLSNAAAIAVFSFRQCSIEISKTIDRSYWNKIADVSKPLLLTTFLGCVVTQIDSLILAGFLATDKVGEYFLAVSLSVQTIMLFGNTVSNVLFPILSDLKSDKKRQLRALERCTEALLLIMSPACLLLSVFSNEIVVFLYGEKWVYVGTILHYMAVFQLVKAFGGCGYAILIANRRYHNLLVLNIYRVIYYTVLACIGVKYGLVSFVIMIGISYIVGEAWLWVSGFGPGGLGALLKLALPHLTIIGSSLVLDHVLSGRVDHATRLLLLFYIIVMSYTILLYFRRSLIKEIFSILKMSNK